MKNTLLALSAALLLANGARAAVITYKTTLSGALEVPSNASTATGFAAVTVDTTANTMNVIASFSGLSAPTSASHIHCCTATPLAGNVGVATTTPSFPGFPLGVTAGSYSQTFDLTQASSYNAAFIAANGGTTAGAEAALLAGLAAGESYYNIHTTVFPGGEIRGYLVAAIIVNPLFSGTSGSCPVQWICAGSPAPGFASYGPTAAQYPGGSPFQTSAFSPTVYGGSGVIRQLTAATWTGGATYHLYLLAGLPLKEPDGSTPVAGWPQAPNGAARLYLTMGNGFGQVAAFDIPSPAPGTWVTTPITFTLPTNSPAIGQSIGVMIYVSAPSGFSANFAGLIL